MSLATGLVLPQLAKNFASVELKSELEVILLRATGLSSLAFSRGSAIVIQNSEDVDQELSLPDDWTAEIIEPVIVKANGFCLGGELKFQREGSVIRVRFSPPYCDLAEIVR
jgi:hypothetical protein